MVVELLAELCELALLLSLSEHTDLLAQLVVRVVFAQIVVFVVLLEAVVFVELVALGCESFAKFGLVLPDLLLTLEAFAEFRSLLAEVAGVADQPVRVGFAVQP
jgi:hypothetical protein